LGGVGVWYRGKHFWGRTDQSGGIGGSNNFVVALLPVVLGDEGKGSGWGWVGEVEEEGGGREGVEWGGGGKIGSWVSGNQRWG